MLSELYAQLPEVGDMVLPKLVFFFDEAHMLFDGTSKGLINKIEQVVRLIRSKGVGIYFITQSPTDIPDSILGQLGNRIQHALRAFTPKDQKAVKSAAQTFRANPAFKTEEAIMELGTGEALVSLLDSKGAPSVVERAKILFPLSQIGAISESQRDQCIRSSRLYGRYDNAIDRESAFEILLSESQATQQEVEQAKTEKSAGRSSSGGSVKKGILATAAAAVITSFARSMGTQAARKVSGGSSRSTTSSSRSSKSMTSKATETAINTATRTITRSILGNLLK